MARPARARAAHRTTAAGAVPGVRLREGIDCDGVAAAVRRAIEQLEASGTGPVRIGWEPAAPEGTGAAGLAAVDVLARVVLAARRSHRQVDLEAVPAGLLELLELCGLAAELLRADREPG